MTSGDTQQFLDALFGGKPDDLYILLWLLRDKSSHWFTDLDQAARFGEAHGAEDVYAGTALSRADHGSRQRLTLTGDRLPAGIVGLWADIDIAGEAHTKPNLPPTAEEAVTILPRDVRPTLGVHSGHGLQFWWLFKEPWIFDTPEEMEQAAILEARWVALLQQRAGAHGWVIDPVSDLTRVMRLPGTTNNKIPGKPVPARILQLEWSDGQAGGRYNPSDFETALEGIPAPSRTPAARGRASEAGPLHLDPNAELPPLLINLLRQVDPRFDASWRRERPDLQDQSQSSYDMALAWVGVTAGLTDQQISDMLIQHRRIHRQQQKLREDYLLRTIAKARASAQSKAGEAGADNGLRFFPLTDAGNAERLVKSHGACIRYCHPTKTWFVWDGRLWTPDNSGRLMDLAKCIARALYGEASKDGDEKLRTERAKWARASESTEKRRAAVTAAQSEPTVPIQMSDFDRDPWLLCAQNGVIDLRTGELRPHRREDFITKLAPAEYDPEARCEEWERFLLQTCAGDGAFVDFLQRAVGYSLTGDTREEKLFFVHGAGATGKSSFLEAVKATLGSYAKTADFDSFVQRREAGGVRDDLAELAGRRFIVSIEVDEGRKMAEGLVKQLTGRDTVRARHLYQSGFEFVPQGKFWLAANATPRVRDNDAALWRRILRVPFDRVVPEDRRDPSLKTRLRDPAISGPGILAWAVKGCLRWQGEGLRVPSRVKEATEEYRQDMDPLRDFLADRCVLHVDAQVSAAELHKNYEEWARENGVKFQLDTKGLAERLRTRGCVDGRGYVAGRRSRVWRGIGLAAREE